MRLFHVQSERIENRGFTLIETLVAITILLLVIMGPISIAARGLKMATHSGDELTATFLAQEGLEAIIKYRDEKALDVLGGSTDETWDWIEENGSNSMQRKCGSASESQYNPSSGIPHRDSACDVSISGTEIEYNACNGTSPQYCGLRYDNDLNRYVSTAYAGAEFNRLIWIKREEINSGTSKAVRVKVRVSWTSGLFNTEKSVVLETWLYDHYNRFSD